MEEFLSSRGTTYETIDERMKLVLDATRLNVEHATGGPFGAAVFEKKSGRLLSVSVNSVVRHGWSGAHAEAMAIIFASKAHGGYDLGGNLTTEHQLVVNAQPCVMCLGSVIWSGVTEVIWGATSREVEEITGFDEGPMPENYVEELKKRGISVTEDIMSEESRDIMALYRTKNGMVYNARLGRKEVARSTASG